MQQKCSVMQFEKRGSQFFLLRPSPPMQIFIRPSSAPYDANLHRAIRKK